MCKHNWIESSDAQFILRDGTQGKARVCSLCRGVIIQCGDCEELHLIPEGAGSDAMPEITTWAWLKAIECRENPIEKGDEFITVPVIPVRMPPDYDNHEVWLDAEYALMDGEIDRYELTGWAG